MPPDTPAPAPAFDSSLGRTLYRLLYDAPTRERYLAGEVITDDADDARALTSIDHAELRDACGRIARDQLRGSGDLAGGLGDAFRRTVAAIVDAGHRVGDLAQAYVRAPEFTHYRELPHAGGPGWCAEEAFYRFLVRTGPRWGLASTDARAVLRHEHLVALLQVLVVNRDPGFAIAEPALVQTARARWVVERYEAQAAAAISPGWDRGTALLVLYAATIRGFVCGPVSAPLVALLRAGSLRAAVAADADADADPDTMRAAAKRLTAMGLLPEDA